MPDKFVHKCPFMSCSYTSFTRPSYKEHEKIHIGDKGLKVKKCNFKDCDLIFIKLDDYNSHMMNVHKVLQSKRPAFVMIPA